MDFLWVLEFFLAYVMSKITGKAIVSGAGS